MSAFLRRRWFLSLVLGGLVLTWWCPDWFHWTRAVDPRFIVAPALFLTAWTLESRSLFRALMKPLPALFAVLISYGLLPALGWATGQLLPSADLRIGLMIVVSVPCTLASALLWTRMAGGNEAVVLLVILFTSGTSWLATTAWLTFGTGTQVAVDTTGMMVGLVLVLVLPIGVGQSFRAVDRLRMIAIRFKQGLGIISQLLVLVIMLKAAVDVNQRLGMETTTLSAAELLGAALFCLGNHLAALLSGFWGSRALGFDRPSQIGIAFACSQKTLPVALFLFDAYFKDYPLAVVPLVFYHVGQLVIDTFVAEELIKQSSQKSLRSLP